MDHVSFSWRAASAVPRTGWSAVRGAASYTICAGPPRWLAREDHRFRRFGDPVLREAAAPAGPVDDRLRGLVRDLLDTVDDPARAGVAANQIGIGQRAFSWHLVETGELGYILNPVIVELSEELQHDDEGCLSLPGAFTGCARPTSHMRRRCRCS